MEETWRQFEAWVTAQGGRHTPERRMLYEAVCAMPQFFTAEDIVEHLSQQNDTGGMRLSRPTVYNNLSAFVCAGLLAHINVKAGHIYVHTAGHDAVVVQECIECGAMQVLKGAGGVAQAVAHLAYRRFTPMRSVTVVQGECSHCETLRRKAACKQAKTTRKQQHTITNERKS